MADFGGEVLVYRETEERFFIKTRQGRFPANLEVLMGDFNNDSVRLLNTFFDSEVVLGVLVGIQFFLFVGKKIEIILGFRGDNLGTSLFDGIKYKIILGLIHGFAIKRIGVENSHMYIRILFT